MTQMSNTVDFVREVVRDLSETGIQVASSGGWADEKDPSEIDLFVLDPDVERLDAFVAGRDEIAEKRFSHRRAFIAGGAVSGPRRHGPRSGTALRTDCGRLSLSMSAGLPVASREYLAPYTRDFATIPAAWLG
jgi:hypothetical protein